MTEPAKKWYESYSPQNLGSFYGRISNQSSGLYLTNTGSTVVGAADGQGDAQVWHFIKQEDNSYEIISMLDQGALDVAGGDTANGTDIRSWPDRNGSLAQRFYIYDLFGAVYLRPLNSNLAVDMDLGEGTHNVAIWGYAADWSPQKFVIEKLAPTKAVLQTDKSVYALYEPITFTASSDYAESFTLHLNGKGVRLMNQNMENGVLTFSIDALGTFSAYVTCSNAVGEKNSAKISFTVEGLKVSNEYVILPIEETYAIQANMEELFYKSHNEEIAAVSPEGMITAKNIGTATISISNADDVVLMKVKVVKPFVLGDCDASGTCDVKDLICLQKWIHMKESKEMIQNYAADLNRDGMIDVFDLGLLKHKLLQQ